MKGDFGRAMRWATGLTLGVIATAAAAAPAEEGASIAIFVLIVLGCAALVMLRRRA